MNQPDVENRHADTVGRGEGEGAMNWESSPETYTLPYVKQIVRGNFAAGRRELKSSTLWL